MKSLHQFTKAILIIILLFSLFLCTENNSPLQEYTISIISKDTVYLEKKNNIEIIGTHYIRKKGDIIGLSGIDRPNSIIPAFRIYNKNGDLIFEKDQYIWKGRPIMFKDFYTTDRYIYLFAGKFLLKYKWNGDLVSFSQLNKNDRTFSLSEQFMVFVEEKNELLINSFPSHNLTVKGDENYYQKSFPIFMLLDSLGNPIERFGSYPEAYNVSTNSLSPSIATTTYNDMIYYVTHTSPNIIVYSYDGKKYKKIKGHKSKYMDYKITPNATKMESIQDVMSRTEEEKVRSYNDRYLNFDVLPDNGYRYYIENRDTSVKDKIIRKYYVMNFYPKQKKYSEFEVPTSNKIKFLNHPVQDELMYYEADSNGQRLIKLIIKEDN